MARRSSTKEAKESSTPVKAASPDETQTQAVGKWNVLFTFTRRQHLLPLTIALIIAIITGATGPALSIFTGKIFDTFANYASGKLDRDAFKSQLSKDSLILASIGVLTFVLGAATFTTFLLFGETQAKTARDTVFEGLLAKPQAWYDTRKTGVRALVARLNTHIRELQLALSQPLCAVFHGGVTCFGSLGVAFFYCWSLTLVILASAPISAVLVAYLSSRIQPRIQRQINAMEHASKTCIGAFTGIETVKLFNGQQIELEKYSSLLKIAAPFYHSQILLNAVLSAFVTFLTYSIFVQGFYYGSHLAHTGKVSTGTVVTTFFSALTASQALQAILPQLIFIEKGRAAALALHSLVESLRPPASGTEHKMLEACLGQIHFRDVCFSYPARPETQALKNVSCSVPSGGTIFIIGQSGSGKSTLAQLLLKCYEPESGEIILDGMPLSKIDTGWLRKNVTLVEQYSTLFHGTISYNISLGADDPTFITPDEVKLATQFALLQQTFNDLPDGLETILNSDTSLSGGQRQRLALARARLRDTPIMFFDESTSALDQASRVLIMSAIRLWRRNKTTIFVSHDIAQIEPDDFVYLFEDGRVVDQGYRKELETLSTTFRKYLNPDQRNSIGAMRDVRGPWTLDKHSSSNYETTYDEDLGLSEQPSRRASKRVTRFSRMFTTIPPATSDFAVWSLGGAVLRSKQYSNLNATLAVPQSKPQPVQRPQEAVKVQDASRRQSQRFSFLKRQSQRMSMGAFDLLEGAGDIARQMRVHPNARPRRVISEESTTKTLSDHQVKTVPGATLGLVAILRTAWPTLTTPLRVYLLIGFVLAGIHAGVTPSFAYVFAKLFSTLYEPNKGSPALIYSMAILALGTVDALAIFLQRILFEKCGQHWADHYRVVAMQAILAQPRQFFLEEGNSPGELAQALDRYADEMRNLLGRFAALGITAVFMILLSLTWSMVTCWKLTLVGLALTPATFAIGWLFSLVATNMETRSQDAALASGSILSEVCTNMKTVRALTLEAHFRTKYTAAVQTGWKIGIRRAVYTSAFYGLDSAMSDFVTALLFYYGGTLILAGGYTVQQVNTVFSMLLFAMTNISSIFEFIPQASSAQDAATRLMHLANLPLMTHEDEGSIRPTTIGDISFKNVNFAYAGQPDQPVLSNVTLTFPAGTVTALVGFSGSGKSTIASLLLRLYPLSLASTSDFSTNASDIDVKSVNSQPRSPSSDMIPLSILSGSGGTSDTGSILVASRPLHRLHTPTLRTLIAVVSQTPTLFPGTVTENICYGLPPSSPLRQTENLYSAALAAGIHDTILSLPSAYQTLVGDGGLTLSGGQTQRLCIARALVRRPAVLVLDECTSALDAESAAGIRETIRDLKRTRKELTVVVITHSVEMMRGCERVVMLEKGEVVEEGGWGELMEGRGRRGKRLRELVRGGVWESGGDGGEGPSGW